MDQVRARLFSSTGQSSTVQWTHKTCRVTEYAVLSGVDTVSCEPCPEGGDCSGSTQRSLLEAAPGPSNRVVQLQNVVALGGYWASSQSDGRSFVKCRTSSSVQACLPGVNGSKVTCAEGYSGTICDVCAVGYVRSWLPDRCPPLPSPFVSLTQTVAVWVYACHLIC